MTVAPPGDGEPNPFDPEWKKMLVESTPLGRGGAHQPGNASSGFAEFDGKETLDQKLAREGGIEGYNPDEYHPEAN